MLVTAKVGETVIAKSKNTIQVEGNYYFPPDSVNKEFLKKSKTHTVCHWKGLCSYDNVEVGGKLLKDSAWHYPEPLKEAQNIKNYYAFWKGVEVNKENQ